MKGKFPLQGFFDATKTVVYAASPYVSRDGADHVLFDGKAGRVVATDGYRLACVQVDWLPDVTFQLPALWIKSMLKRFDVKGTYEHFSKIPYELKKGKLDIEIARTQIEVSLGKERFIDYSSLVDVEFAGNGFTVERAKLLKLLRATLKWSKDKKRTSHRTIMKFNGNAVYLTVFDNGRQKDMGHADIVIEGKAEDCIVNTEHMLDALKKFATKNVTVAQAPFDEVYLLMLGSHDDLAWQKCKVAHLQSTCAEYRKVENGQKEEE